jgi:putative membrane protein
MKRTIGLVGCAVVIWSVLSAPVSAQKIDSKDADFVKEAAQGGELEVQLGQIALLNASSEEVKLFAKRMVDDHSKSNKELTSLAGNKGLALTRGLDKKCQEMCDKLSKLKGKQFDKEYMRHMLEDHEQDVAKFQTNAKLLQDADFRGWALKTLPILNEHLRLAKEIHGKVEKK